jgi:type 1 glutamine amidotransferase
MLRALVALLLLPTAQEARPEPLKVVFFTGGGYHDYKKLAPLLTEKMAALANVKFDVKWDLAGLKELKDGAAYDAVVYDTCFDDAKDDPELIERLRKVTREGKPTVMIHCAVHTFRVNKDWSECCGQLSRVHDPYQAFGTEKADKDHPVMKTWPDEWKTEGDELYNTIELYKDSHALLKAKSPKTGKEHVVCWTVTYGKGKVFATTLGHDLKTAGQADYHRLLAYGLLWTCGKLGDDGKPIKGYDGPGPK